MEETKEFLEEMIEENDELEDNPEQYFEDLLELFW